MPKVSLTPRKASLLTFLSFTPLDEPGLDPVRIMKGLFVVNQELSERVLPREARYTFVPYDYGPFSKAIYRDLDVLRAMGLLVATAAPGRNWDYHNLSKAGRQRVIEGRLLLDARAVEYMRQVYEWVSSQRFASILKAVYARYPEYAENSVFVDPGE